MFSLEHFQFETFQNFTFERKFCLYLENIFCDPRATRHLNLKRFSKFLGLVLKAVSELYLDLGISLKVFANLSFSALEKFLRLNRNEMSIEILIVYLVVVACHVLWIYIEYLNVYEWGWIIAIVSLTPCLQQQLNCSKCIKLVCSPKRKANGVFWNQCQILTITQLCVQEIRQLVNSSKGAISCINYLK